MQKIRVYHGTERLNDAIAQRKYRLAGDLTYAPMVASTFTLGFGGSAGSEGPIAYTGAAIGSNIGKVFRATPEMMKIMLACGASAGIAGIFRAPIAGMLFTLEVLMIDLSGMTVMPLLLSSVAGAVVAYVLEGYNAEFFFVQSESFVTNRIPFTILLGVVCGLMSYYFTKVMFMMESMFSKLRHTGLKILVGGVIMAGLIFLFPPLYGEGYEAINNLLLGDVSNIVDGTFFYVDRDNVWFLILFIGAIALTKAFATSATNGAGGVGGTFAPSLFVGALTGFLFAYIVNNLDLGFQLSQKNFALMGMAGVMSGVMHAPLMAIFLTAEMTGGYDLFLPLLIVSALAYITIRIFTPYSIYTMRLAKAGDLVTHQKDKAVLTLLKVDNLIETDFKIVHPEMNLKEMVDTISVSNRNLFPVTDSEGNLKGVVLLDEIRNIMFRADLYKKMHVSRFMSAVPEVIEITYPMDKVMEIFDRTNAWNLPVVDNGRYVGFVSKSKIFNSYRRVLRHFTED